MGSAKLRVPRREPEGPFRLVLAAGSHDGTVRLWDPTTATPVGDLLTGHAIGVTALAAVPRSHGPTMLATGSSNGMVRR